MRGTRRILLSGALLLSTLSIATAASTTVAPSAGADAVGTCRNGTPVPDPVALKVDGVPAARVEAGIFQAGPGAVEWAFTICRDSNNHAYTISILRVNRVGDVPQYADLLAEDLSRQFNISFAPNATDIPLVAMGHADINGFTIGGALTSIIAKPRQYSDIWGSACPGQGPTSCATNVTTASVDYPAQFLVSVRYKDSTDTNPMTNGGADLESLPGMYWSSAAYYFYQWTNCPAMDPVTQNQNVKGFQVDLAGPHLKHDGTPNFGFVEVYIPTAALLSCFGGTPDMVKAALMITRVEGSTSTPVTETGNANLGLDYDITTSDAGLLIKFNKIAFSVPTYKITTKRTSGSSTTTNVNLARTTKTYDQLRSIVNTGVPLANQLPKFGSGKLVVTSQSTSVCRPGTGVGQGTKMFGIAAGTCNFTIKSYNVAGVLKGTKTGSFTVA